MTMTYKNLWGDEAFIVHIDGETHRPGDAAAIDYIRKEVDSNRDLIRQPLGCGGWLKDGRGWVVMFEAMSLAENFAAEIA